MAKIKGFNLRQEHIDALKKIIDGLAQRELREFARLMAGSDGGEKTQLLEKIYQKLNDDTELNSEQIRFLFKNAPYRNLFEFLPVSVLREYASQIANLIGIEKFELLILLSDKTEEMRSLIGTIQNINPDRINQFKIEFSRKLKQQVLEPLNIDFTNTGESVVRLQCENIRLNRQVKELNETINGMRNKHDEKIKKLTEKINDLNITIDSLKRDIENLRLEKTILENDLNRSRSALEVLQTQFEERLEEEIEKRLVSSLRSWFPQAMAVGREAANNNNDVIKFAENILKLQEERDRNVGNRLILKRRLEELEKIRNKLIDALENALNPIPELKHAISRVDEEIRRINFTLGESNEYSEIQEMLLTLVNSVRNVDEYDTLLRFASFLKEHQFIDNDLLKRIWDVMYSRYSINFRLEPTPESVRDYSFRRKLRDNASFIIIFDSHNIILHDALKSKLRADTQEQSRNNLLQLIKPLAERYDRVKFIMVFDGSYPHEETVTSNVKIVFSGGEGEHRADVKIIELVRMNPGTELFVVTDDEDLIRNVRHYGAQPIKVLMFMWTLQESGILPQTFLGWT